MSDLKEQAVIQPRFEYTPPKVRSIGKRSTQCPNCGNRMALKQPMCRDCSCRSKRPPEDPKIYFIEYEPCRKLPLRKGGYVWVDADLYDYLMQWRWSSTQRLNEPLYAHTYVCLDLTEYPKKFTQVKLHHIVAGVHPKTRLDHRNRNSVDNRRNNLRPCTNSQNAANRKVKTGRTGFIGVRQPKSMRTFMATVQTPKGRIYKSGFCTAEAAAVERDKMALISYGEYAVLNFPEKREQLIAELSVSGSLEAQAKH